MADDEAPLMTRGHLALVIGVNAAVLAELTLAMFLASADPDNFTAVFMKAFFGLLIPTLAAGVFLKRRLRSASRRTKPR